MDAEAGLGWRWSGYSWLLGEAHPPEPLIPTGNAEGPDKQPGTGGSISAEAEWSWSHSEWGGVRSCEGQGGPSEGDTPSQEASRPDLQGDHTWPGGGGV